MFNVLGILLITGIFVVLLGVAAFWGFGYFIKQKISTYERSQTQAHNDFVFLLVHILVHIAKIDGNISREELNTIINFFRVNLRYSYDRLYWVKELIKEAQGAETTLEELVSQFKSQFAYEPRLILLELIYQVIYSGDKFVDPEIAIAQQIADFLEISADDQQSIKNRRMYRRRQAVNDVQQSLEILGLSKGATAEEVKKAYRKLSMTYHPDKVGHLGDEFKQVAEEKMKEINAAYQLLKKSYL